MYNSLNLSATCKTYRLKFGIETFHSWTSTAFSLFVWSPQASYGDFGDVGRSSWSSHKKIAIQEAADDELA